MHLEKLHLPDTAAVNGFKLSYKLRFNSTADDFPTYYFKLFIFYKTISFCNEFLEPVHAGSFVRCNFFFFVPVSWCFLVAER